MIKQREKWVDYAKGIGIILVVYAHLLSSGFNAGLSIPVSFFIYSDSVIYSFHMPLFFFLAGLFVEKSLQRKDTLQFVKDKFVLLAYPYLVWSCIQGVGELLFSSHSHRGVAIWDIMAIPYFPLAQFWFLYALLLMYCVFAIVRALERFTAPCLFLLAVLLAFFPLRTEVMALVGFSTEFIFFVVGWSLRKYFFQLGELNISWKWLTTAGLLFAVAEFVMFKYITEPVRLAGSGHPLVFLALALLGISFVVLLSQYLAQNNLFSFIKTLGVYSLQIYLVHMLAGVAVRIFLLSFFSIENPVIHMIVGVIGGLVIPVVLYTVTRKIYFPYLFELKRVK